MHRLFHPLVCFVVGLHLSPDLLADEQTGLETLAVPILRSHCQGCHGATDPAGALRLDNLSTDFVAKPQVAEVWHRILKMVEAGEMPPPDAKPLPATSHRKLTASISAALDVAIKNQQQTGGGSVSRRLNRFEYAQTMRDLLGIDMDYTGDLPDDPPSDDGFRNDGHSLQMSAEQLAAYLDVARRAVGRAIVTSAPPPPYQREFDTSNVSAWLGKVEFSNILERSQQFIVKMEDDYPEKGPFTIQVTLSTDRPAGSSPPVMELSLGYRPDTEIFFRQIAVREISDEGKQTLEFHGYVEDFPLPVRGQGKFPGLVIRIRNIYGDGSQLPSGVQDKVTKRWSYPGETGLPKLIVHGVTFRSPGTPSWPPLPHTRLLPPADRESLEEIEYVSQVLHGFMPLAYRRPVTTQEVAGIAEYFATIRSQFASFEEAIRETLAYVLIRPEFLYLLETTERSNHQLDEWELASRLSYFLWSTMPDSTLRELADAGLLRSPEYLATQVDRLLDDERSMRFVEQFSAQWLQLESLEQVAVDREAYPDFDDTLIPDLRRETQLFLKEILDRDLSALALIDSSFMVVNERLAKHYGIPGVVGTSFRPIPVPPASHRGGLLGQASILLSNSTGRDSHPIRRAVWIRDRLLNDPPAPPPPDVPPLDEADPKFFQLSIRQQLEIHRNTESCSQCHRSLDPWGISLENWDAVGRWRDQIPRRGPSAEAIEDGEAGPVKRDESTAKASTSATLKETSSALPQMVDATAVFPDGRTITGVDELKAYILEERRQDFARSLVARLFTYALGRRLQLRDQHILDELTKRFVEDNFRLAPLIKNIVKTPSFQTK